jgi:hypothetical protein
MRQNDLLHPRQIVVWGAIESSLDRELLARKLLTKLLRNVFVVLVKTMDGHEAARGVSFLSLVEIQTCHWWEV